MSNSLKLSIRLALLGFLTVVLQQAAVSQISVFGVSADLTPLVVMSVGLLTGSMLGAITGFGIGLFVDMVFVQTLGVTSLLYIAIGYGSGRLRELRDPSHGLVPLVMGAAATAFAGIGMALIQFLLGVDAPVSLLLVQQILITILVNTLIALARLRAGATGDPARAARGPAPPAPPRLHDRRSQPAAAALATSRPDSALARSMIQLPEDRRPPMTPQLALRVAVLGSVALAMFAIIFFRLWFLQVLSGDQYVKEAKVNRVRDVEHPRRPRRHRRSRGRHPRRLQTGPRGPDLPARSTPQRPARAKMYRRLAHILGVSTRPRRCRVPGQGTRQLAPIPCDVAKQVAILPYANVTLKTDVPRDVLYYIDERQAQFQGVVVQQVWLRQYPLHDLAAQLFGTVGPITPQEVKMPRYHGVSEQSIVGQSGLEYYYDRYLRGEDGADRVQVDALGQFRGYLRQKPPVAGHTLKLSLDLGLQRAGQQALSEAIANNPPATAGAFVALNPQNGEVYAMGSSPTFDPNIFTKPVPESVYKQLNNAASNYPLFNRAIQSSYPTGSTFKGISSIAALQSGAWSLDETYDDTGVYSNGPGDTRHNAGHAAYGVLNLTQAIMVSSDNFFYNLGRLHEQRRPQGRGAPALGARVRDGSPDGIDLGGENAGILPTPTWRANRDKLERQCERGTGPFRGHGRHKSCGIADGRPWSVGDNENLAVGQGDLEATPLQLAVAYSTIENGGNVVRPHVGLEVDAPDGTLLQKIDPPPSRHVKINPANLQAMHTGLHEAASQPGGTSADVFAGWPQSQYPVYGKTGTAQHDNQADQSWYVCYVPDPIAAHPRRGDRRAGRIRCRRRGAGRPPDSFSVVHGQAR